MGVTKRFVTVIGGFRRIAAGDLFQGLVFRHARAGQHSSLGYIAPGHSSGMDPVQPASRGLSQRHQVVSHAPLRRPRSGSLPLRQRQAPDPARRGDAFPGDWQNDHRQTRFGSSPDRAPHAFRPTATVVSHCWPQVEVAPGTYSLYLLYDETYPSDPPIRLREIPLSRVRTPGSRPMARSVPCG
jgi:hypothetical protein